MKKYGFTLVELSVVLVIIGLLAGGIVVGQVLARSSQIRSVAAEYSRYTQAIRNFRDKYQELPGDCSRAASIWSGETSGNGDGWINGLTSVSPQNEQFLAWRHLGKAQLIDGAYNGVAGAGGDRDRTSGINVPASKLSGANWGLTSFSLIDIAAGTGTNIPYITPDSTHPPDIVPNHVLWLGGATSNAGATTVSYAPVLTTDEAYDVDQKMDDGLPQTGKIVAQINTGAYTCNQNSTTNSYYVITSAGVAVTGLQCSLIFKTGF